MRESPVTKLLKIDTCCGMQAKESLKLRLYVNWRYKHRTRDDSNNDVALF